MKSLVVEDDLTNRFLLRELLRSYGTSDAVTNGKEAVAAIKSALAADTPYDLVCLDIMMPEMDGHQALKDIRAVEQLCGIEPGWGVKVVMVTIVNDKNNVMNAFREQCDGYLVKPVDQAKLLEVLRELHLVT